MATQFIPLRCPVCPNKVGVHPAASINASCSNLHRPVLMVTADGKPYHSSNPPPARQRGK